MTLTCPSPSCPMCTGEVCHSCTATGQPIEECQHVPHERHRPLTPDDFPDVTVIDEDPSIARAPTKPLTINIELEVSEEDAESIAQKLEHAAQLLRSRRRLTITLG